MNRRQAITRLTTSAVGAAAVSQIISTPAFADGGSANSVPNPPSTVGVLIIVSPSEQRFDVQLTLGATSCPRGTVPNARIDTKWNNFAIIASPAPALTSIAPSPTRTVYTPNSGTTPTSFSAVNLFQVNPTGRGPNTKYVVGDILRFDIHYRWVCRNNAGQAVWVCKSFRYTVTFTTSAGNLLGTATPAAIAYPGDCDTQPPVAP